MNRHRLLMLLPAVAAMIALAGCASHHSQNEAASTLSSADRTFLENAAQGGHAEVQGSQMALEKTSSADVKSFAEMMIKDHGQANKELKALAESKGFQLPVELEGDKQDLMKELREAEGASFDDEYVDEVAVDAHEEAVDLFEDAAENAEDADIKAFAAKLLPTLKAHHEQGEKLDDLLDDADDRKRSDDKAATGQGAAAGSGDGSVVIPKAGS